MKNLHLPLLSLPTHINLPFFLSAVAINLIVQHIQDILNGDLCKWHRGGAVNGHSRGFKRAASEQGDLANFPPGKRVLLEPSSRPH